MKLIRDLIEGKIREIVMIILICIGIFLLEIYTGGGIVESLKSALSFTKALWNFISAAGQAVFAVGILYLIIRFFDSINPNRLAP